MEKLAVVLDGYDSVEVVPSLFVLMGNFCSQPCNLAFNSFEELRLQFGKLGEMIAARSRLKEHSRFLFIPGPDDAGPSKALPRCALLKYLIEELPRCAPPKVCTSMMSEKFDMIAQALKDDGPKVPTSKEVLAALKEIPGLDEDTELDLFDLLTSDARKFESLLALPMETRKKWLLRQLKKRP